MRTLTRLLALTLVFCLLPTVIRAEEPAATAPTTRPVPPAAKVVPWEPAVKTDKTGQVDAGFLKQHESFLARGKQGEIGLLLLGDSITEGWNKDKADYDATFGQYHPANFGISGDRTEHILWRITNGELDGIKPKVVMLMIGTNNVSTSDAAGIAKGITTIVETIRHKLPDTKILLLGILPRGEPEKDANTRKKIVAINDIIEKLDDGGKHIQYMDFGPAFLDEAFIISKDLMPDALHPNANGYKIWMEAVKEPLATMMK